MVRLFAFRMIASSLRQTSRFAVSDGFMRVTMAEQHDHDPVAVAKAWVDSLDPVQRFDEVSDATG